MLTICLIQEKELPLHCQKTKSNIINNLKALSIMVKYGQIWKIASKELEDTKLMERLLHDFLMIREDDEEAIKAMEEYAKEHIDRTHFHKQIAEYVYGLILDGAYQFYKEHKEHIHYIN